MTISEILEKLTAKGGPFPLAERTIHGARMMAYDRDPRTLRDVFALTERYADRTALIYEGQRWTYAEQHASVGTLARSMRDRFGIGHGDRVAIALRNYPEWIFAFWATQVLGAIAVPLNAWATGDELKHMLGHCEPKLLFADNERLDRLRAVDGLPDAVVGVRAAGQPGIVSFEDLIAATVPQELPRSVAQPDDIATIIYTSGTTGRPKGVVTSHFAHTASLLNRYIRVVAAVCIAQGNLAEPDQTEMPRQTKLMAYPLFHVAGIGTTCAAAFNGHTLITMYKWDADKAADIIADEQISELTGPPLISQQILLAARRTPEKFGSLRLLGAGGASLPAGLLAEIAEVFQGRVGPTTGYGLTETTGGVISISGDEFITNPDSIGRPLPTIEARIVDADRKPMPDGEPGELAIRAPQLMNGYYRDDEATREAIVDGWFHTGDLAARGKDGRYRLVGRLKDIVIRGGENINCGQVETCMSDHPAVAEVAVIGTPHPTLGEELVALIRLHPGSQAEPTELRAFVGERLAAFKVPAHVIFQDDPFPRTASGKILKREMKIDPEALQSREQAMKG